MPVVSFVATVNQRDTEGLEWLIISLGNCYVFWSVAGRPGLLGISFDRRQNTDFRIFSVRQEKGHQNVS